MNNLLMNRFTAIPRKFSGSLKGKREGLSFFNKVFLQPKYEMVKRTRFLSFSVSLINIKKSVPLSFVELEANLKVPLLLFKNISIPNFKASAFTLKSDLS